MRVNVKLVRLQNRVNAAIRAIAKGTGSARKLRQRQNVLARAQANGWQNRLVNMARNGQPVSF